VTPDSDAGPKISVLPLGAGTPRDGLWRVELSVTNEDASPITLLAAWLPHERFRADEQRFDGMAPLDPGERVTLLFDAEFDEPPDTDVQNGFVIIRVEWNGGVWRVLTRMAVAAGAIGEPTARVETVSAHRVGFSG
jgi:hypothetical protein